MTKRANTAKKRILLVEGDPRRSEHATVLQDSLAVSVDVAKNGHEALAQLKKQNYDLIITEFLMPGMNAEELCQNLSGNKQLQSIPVLMMSLLPLRSEQFQRSLSNSPHFRSVRGVLEKPLKKGMLAAEVNVLLALT